MTCPGERSVRVERIDDLAILTLDRPHALNSLTLELIADFHSALDRILAERPPVRCLMITGAGRAFCAGGDISAHRDRPSEVEPYDLAEVLHRHFNPVLLRLLRLPIPFINAVNGPAAGAGCPLALAGDIVVAARSAVFECGFARIGLMPDLGATWLLPRLVGRARAHAMMMLDQRVPAQQAEAWGMILRCVDDEALPVVALELARELAAKSLPAVVATRQAVLVAAADGISQALEVEAQAQRALGFSADFAEGTSAFFARRPAHFQDL